MAHCSVPQADHRSPPGEVTGGAGDGWPAVVDGAGAAVVVVGAAAVVVVGSVAVVGAAVVEVAACPLSATFP